MTTSEPRLVRAVGATFRDLGREVIIAPPGRDDFEALSGPAIDVWSLLTTPRTVPEIVEVLARRYRSDEGEIERDVRALLDRLESSKAIEVRDAG